MLGRGSFGAAAFGRLVLLVHYGRRRASHRVTAGPFDARVLAEAAAPHTQKFEEQELS